MNSPTNQTMPHATCASTTTRFRFRKLPHLLPAALLALGICGIARAATINYVGSLINSVETTSWLTPTTPKTYDVDGDNKYGTFGGLYWGEYTNYSGGTISFVGISNTNNAIDTFGGLYAQLDSLSDAAQGNTGAGALVNNSPVQSTSQHLRLTTGNTSGTSGWVIGHTFQVNSNLTGKTLRVGIMTDDYGQSLAFAPQQDSGKGLWIAQTAGGSVTSLVAPAPAGDANRVPDMMFFDIVNAQAGDQYTIFETRGLYVRSNPNPYLSQFSFDVADTTSVPATLPFINTNLFFNTLSEQANPSLYPPFTAGSGAIRTNGNFRFGALVGSSQLVTYQWLHEGAPINNATNATYDVVNATGADAGAYQVVATTTSGSVTGHVMNLSVLGVSQEPQVASFRAQAFSTPGLYAYYGFDHGCKDMAGTNDGVFVGTPGAGTTIGTGLGSGNGEFNGFNPAGPAGTFLGAKSENGLENLGAGYVQVPYNPAFDFADGNATLVMWVRPEWVWTGGYTPSFLMANGNYPNNVSWAWAMGRTKAGFVAANGTNTPPNASIPNQNLDVNRWYMLTAVFSNGTYRGYCNGVLLGSAAAANPTNQPFAIRPSAGLPLIIGAADSTGTNNWSGGLDEIAIYTNVLSSAQIRALFDARDLPYAVTQPVGGSFAPGDAYAISFVASNDWSRYAASPANGQTAFVPNILSYQWFKNGSPLAGETASTLNFPSLAAGDAATYECVVTNNVTGSVTSSVASIAVAYPTLTITASGGNATVSWPASYALTGWTLETSPLVSPTTWTEAATNPPAVFPITGTEQYFRLHKP